MKIFKIFNIMTISIGFFFMPDCKESSMQMKIPEMVDVETNINNFKEFPLSQLNPEIAYVQLKSDKYSKIDGIVSLDFTDNLISISTLRLCLIYDFNGTLIRQISNSGRGPKEFNFISNSGFGLNNNIIIQTQNDFFEYNIDGVYLSKFDISRTSNPRFYVSSWVTLDDSLFFGHTPLTTGKDATKAILFNRYGRILIDFKNYIFLNRLTPMFTSDDSQVSIYKYKNIIHFKEKMNDTLFYLTKEYDLLPRLTFNLGKYKMPKEFREKVSSEGSTPIEFNYIFVNNIFEINDYLLFDCLFNKYMPAKRITPRDIMGQQIWYNTLNVMGLYNKKNKLLVFCMPTTTDNPLFTSGFYNDMDAGPRFYPMKQVNDSTLVMWLNAKELKDHIASQDFKENMPKYPERKKELENMAHNLTEFDNPVLMFVTIKKNKNR